MPKKQKSDCAECRKEPLIFPDRVTVRLDDDVRALCNASAAAVDWANQAHLINAALRRALLPWKTNDIAVRVDPFEQLVFFRRMTCKRTPKPARK